MSRITKILTLLVFSVTTGYGQNYEPMDLAKMIFGKDSLFPIENFITGEYRGQPNGQDLQNDLTTTFSLLGLTDKKAVVAMSILDSAGIGLDTYLHFTKESIWKMSAFRALAMMGIIEQVKIQLEQMTLQEVDDIIAKGKKNGEDNFEGFSSREDYYFALGNASLTIELDHNIVKHFLTNQLEFERLKNLALRQLENENVHEERSERLIETFKADYQKLFISSVSSGGYELGNCINFLIGGIIDNTVGYIYVKEEKDCQK